MIEYDKKFAAGWSFAVGRVPEACREARHRTHPCMLGAVVCVWSLLSLLNDASAQTAGAPAASESAAQIEGSVVLNEVIVTAEHFKQSAQETPIAMSVFSGEALKENDVTDIAGLTAIAPDLGFTVTEGKPIVTIRGISSRDTTENGDPAVTVDTDGFYLNRPYALDATLYDIDRIEVLRGPQGTLNGRNSVGGAINIVTAKPTDQFAAYTSLQYGNYNDLQMQGMVNLPISEQVQARAAFLSVSHDGYRANFPQPKGDDADNKSGRLELAFAPVPQLRGLVTAQFTTEQGVGDVTQYIPFIYTPTGALDHNVPPGINSETFSLGTRPYLDLHEKQIRLNFVYDLPGVQITALGGYDKTEWHHAVDQSNPDANPSAVQFQENQYPETFNGELRAASNSGSAFQWQVGGFFFSEKSHLLSADAAPLAGGGFDYYFGFAYRTRSRSEAGYAQASYQLTSALKLTAGVRHTHDYKEESGYYGNISRNIVYSNQNGSAASSKPTFHAALDYDLTRSNLLYAKFDTGYKAGGFNFGGSAYSPETANAYEIGSKNRFLDNKLQLNLAAYYIEYSNQQVSTYAYLPNGQPVQLTLNAGSSQLYGAEADLIYALAPIGTLNISADHLHARYTNFLSVADPSDPTASGNVQLAGNELPQSPAWSVSLGLQHDWNVSGATLTGRIQSKAQTFSYFSFYNFRDTRQAGYTMSDAFLTYQPGANRWKVTAFVHNLENAVVFKDAEESQYAAAYAYEFYPPRTYGARIEVSW